MHARVTSECQLQGHSSSDQPRTASRADLRVPRSQPPRPLARAQPSPPHRLGPPGGYLLPRGSRRRGRWDVKTAAGRVATTHLVPQCAVGPPAAHAKPARQSPPLPCGADVYAPFHRPDAFDPPTQSPCPPRWCPFISPGFGATIRLRGPTEHVLHTHHSTERLQGSTLAKPTRNTNQTQHTHNNLTHPRPRRTPALDGRNQKTGSHHHSMPYQSKTVPTPSQLLRRITAAGDAQRTPPPPFFFFFFFFFWRVGGGADCYSPSRTIRIGLLIFKLDANFEP